VHGRLGRLRDREDPLAMVAAEWAAETRVLCFDEFHVSDIADAMLLGRLLQGLFKRGVTLVVTSNTAPDDLYKGGLQRERFLPAIEQINRHCRVLNVDGDTDYRLRELTRARLYYCPSDSAARENLAADFGRLCENAAQATTDTVLCVEGRDIPVHRLAAGVAWFDFKALCEGPRSQADYIEIARRFHSVLIEGLPVFDRDQEDAARRFIALVDEFYDRGVKLILAAAAPAAGLYQGHRLAFEFERTRSRLEEMQSRDYLATPHQP